MSRSIPRGLALLTGSAALWLVPATVGPELLAYLARGYGVELRFEAPRPIWPLGLRARRVEVESSGLRASLDAAHLALRLRGVVGSAHLGSGTVNLRLGWTGTGSVRLEGIELGALIPRDTAPLPLAGRLDGAARSGGSSRSFSAWITNGAVLLGPQDRGRVPFGLLIAEAVEQASSPGRWSIRVLHLEGPALTLEGSGAILPGERLRVRLEISAMNDLVRTALARVGLPTRPLPVRLALQGTVSNPRLAPLSE